MKFIETNRQVAGNGNSIMKAISIKPKLNAAFKVVQPLPALTSPPPIDLHHAAAPRFDMPCRGPEATRNPTRGAAVGETERCIAERSRLSSLAALGAVQSCAAMADLRSHVDLSPALEARLMV